MAKKITIGSKPNHSSSQAIDAWVNDRPIHKEPTKRFTIDVPISLHQRFKSQCALNGVQMADVVRELLEQHFKAEEKRGTTEELSDFRKS